MSSKNISLALTNQALQDLTGALSECSAVVGEQQINAGQKDQDYHKKIEEAQQKIELLTQSSQDAIEHIRHLAAKLDKVIS